MFIASNKQPAGFWSKRNFWNHLAILFAVFVYFYSPLVDHALGYHTHSRPHNHIPARLAHGHSHDHLHQGHELHIESETTDSHICSLEIEGLILLGIFLTFIALTRQPIRNVFIYKVKTSWTKLSLVGQPPPHPPPRFYSLAI